MNSFSIFLIIIEIGTHDLFTIQKVIWNTFVNEENLFINLK